MSGLMDKAKNALGNKADKDAQPGNSVERKADDFANNEANNAAGQAGLPQQDDGKMDTLVDDKVNSDIPFGNK